MSKNRQKKKARVSGEDQVVLGAFAAPHGVRGLIKVKAFTADPLAIASYGPVYLLDGQQVTLTTQGMNKGFVLTAVEGIDSRNQVAMLKGQTFSVARKNLPLAAEDEVYQTDLISCIVEDPDLGQIGTVTAIFDFGGGTMLDVKRSNGQSAFLPFGGAYSFTLNDGIITLKVDKIWLDDKKTED